VVAFSCQFSNQLDGANAQNVFFLTHSQPLSCAIVTDHPLTASVSLLISFIYLFYKFNFKIIILDSLTIIGCDGLKENAFSGSPFSQGEERVDAGCRAVDG